MTQKELFAAANSGRGFANFYPQIFERDGIKHRYLIKGGPGTGKSTFMRKIAAKAREAGLEVEYYRCSSDPTSLDGLIIGGRLAIMDATSPHSVEAEIAGAQDELVDLGQFWNAEGLSEELEEIRRLGREKSDCYRSAYAYLQGALSLDERARELGQSLLNKEKMIKAIERISKKLKNGTDGKPKIGIVNSIGMKGRFRLDTYERLAGTIYYIEDFFMTGAIFLGEIAQQAVLKNKRMSVSYDPLNPKHPDGLLLEDEGVAFVLCEDKAAKDGARRINMKRFARTAVTPAQKERLARLKKEYKTNRRICDGLVTAAVVELKQAGEYHFALEEIYKKYMDFEGQTAFAQKFASKVVRKLQNQK